MQAKKTGISSKQRMHNYKYQTLSVKSNPSATTEKHTLIKVHLPNNEKVNNRVTTKQYKQIH